jgi:hypothetical protein
MAYGRQLVGSAIEGASSALRGEPVNSALSRAVRTSLPLGVLAACASLTLSALRRRPPAAALLNGLAGGAIGFTVGVLWSSRNLTTTAAHGMMSSINAARDAHWLEQNPIDYA